MNKELSKAIMSRSRLRNKFNKNKTPENWEKYRIQRNKCTSINKKAKKDFFKNEMKNANPQQARFWQILKPYITDKGHHNNEDYMLEEKGEIIKDKHKISNIFNEYYINIVEHSTSKKHVPFQFTGKISEIDQIVNHYKKHLRIKLIKAYK